MSRRGHYTLPDDLYEWLVAEAIKQSRSQGHIVRKALEEERRTSERRAVLGGEVEFAFRRFPRVVRRIHPKLDP